MLGSLPIAIKTTSHSIFVFFPALLEILTITPLDFLSIFSTLISKNIAETRN